MSKNTSHHRHIPAMLFVCNEVCAHRHVPVVGALIEGAAFRTTGAWLLRFDEMPCIALHPNLPREAEKVPVAMDALAADPASHLNNGRDATLFLLFDAIVPNIATLLDTLYLRLTPRAPHGHQRRQRDLPAHALPVRRLPHRAGRRAGGADDTPS